MYTNTIFILYIIALLISLVCLVFIGLIFVSKKERINETYIAVRRFAVVVMLTDILYFVFYYREIVRQQYDLDIGFRIIDYVLYTALFFCWILVMKKLLISEKHRKLIAVMAVLSSVRLASSLLIAVVFMGDYYNIENPHIRELWTMAEGFFIAVTAAIIIYCGICIMMESISGLKKQYAVFCSGILLVWSVVQGIVDMGLFNSTFGVSAWSMETPDFTGAALFFINLANSIFVFREDFSPLFFPGQSGEALVGEESEISEKLDVIAAAHRLTVREREVVELIYKGYTNPDIAEALFISVNTVKKHTHNIFEKMDVTNRMEVAHLINIWKHKN